MSIEEFSRLLSSEEESPLIEALRKLTEIEDPETVSDAHASTLAAWGGWRR